MAISIMARPLSGSSVAGSGNEKGGEASFLTQLALHSLHLPQSVTLQSVEYMYTHYALDKYHMGDKTSQVIANLIVYATAWSD